MLDLQDQPTDRLASRLLSWGIPFFYFLTSIAFYLRTYDSAQVKITIVQMLGTVLIGLFYVMLLSRWRRIDGSRIGPLAIPLGISLVSGLLSLALCAYPGNSLDEVLRRVFYAHLALIVLFEIKTLERMKRLVKFLLAATVIASVYGLMQHLDFRFYRNPMPGWLDPFVWRQAFGNRIFSTFGNPNFFGNFLVILTPITLALLLRRQRERPASVLLFSIATIFVSIFLWQSTEIFSSLKITQWESPVFMMVLLGYIFYATLRFSSLGTLFFLITLTNFYSYSKGAWVGYAGSFISFLMLVLFYFSQFRSDSIKRALQTAAWLTLVLMAIAVAFYSQQRVDSIRFRLVTWTSTWEMAQMSPIIGNGVGSFRVLYPAFRRPQIFHIEGKHNTETDHAENEYLEVLMDEGIIGIGIFLWLILIFSLSGVRALDRFTQGLSIRDPVSGKRKVSDDPRAYYMLGFLAAFWGMLLHNFMDVSLRFVSSGIFLWLLMGLIGAMVVHDPMAETDEHLEAREGTLPPTGPPSTLALIGSAIVALAYAILAWKVVKEFHDAQGALPGPFGEALLWLLAWTAFLGTILWVFWGLYRLSRTIRHPVIYLVLLAILFPLRLFWGFFMADVHHNRGIFFSKQGKWEEAIRQYEKTVSLNPNYLMAYYFMGNVYTDRWQEGDFERAMDKYRALWKLAPNYVQSHHQAGLVHLKKAEDDRRQWETLRSQGRQSEAQQALVKLMDDWRTALVHFGKYHAIDPVFEANFARAAWVHMRLGEIFAQQGNTTEANRHFDEVESQYKEAVEAWGCRKPEHDMMGENWERTHRHYHRPYAAEMFENLGNIRFMRGRLRESIKAYRMALHHNPKNDRVLQNLRTAQQRLINGR